MTDQLFRQTLVQHMCDDLPTMDETIKAERADRERFLDDTAVQKGFTDWVDAYHRFRPVFPRSAQAAIAAQPEPEWGKS